MGDHDSAPSPCDGHVELATLLGYVRGLAPRRIRHQVGLKVRQHHCLELETLSAECGHEFDRLILTAEACIKARPFDKDRSRGVLARLRRALTHRRVNNPSYMAFDLITRSNPEDLGNLAEDAVRATRSGQALAQLTDLVVVDDPKRVDKRPAQTRAAPLITSTFLTSEGNSSTRTRGSFASPLSPTCT